MDSIRFLCITLCVFGIFEKPNLVQGGKLNLMSNLMKQADTLKHGLDLANQVGDIGKFLFGHCTHETFLDISTSVPIQASNVRNAEKAAKIVNDSLSILSKLFFTFHHTMNQNSTKLMLIVNRIE